MIVTVPNSGGSSSSPPTTETDSVFGYIVCIIDSYSLAVTALYCYEYNLGAKYFIESIDSMLPPLDADEMVVIIGVVDGICI